MDRLCPFECALRFPGPVIGCAFNTGIERIRFDISLYQSRLTTASGASLRRRATSSNVGAVVESS